MSLINWIFDIYQHGRIDRAEKESQAVRQELAQMRASASAGTAGAPHGDRVAGELALSIKTLQRMMVQKGLCTAEEFKTLLDEVDVEDGQRDGRAPI
ncbi:MAG TPA: hypothetical protein EYQ74_10550 [Planctomycetes bacterium]|nr:hypothetical protein [Planctomycetota bacterium]HIK59480.1 hypothetical protein [Planctomycetota bacterium]